MLLILWTVALLHVVSGQDEDYCYADNTNPYLMFSETTAYEIIYNRAADLVNINLCQPVQFWMLARHGTRYPDKDTITSIETLPDLRDDIVKNHEEQQTGRLCAQDLDNLKKWTPQVVSSLSSDLTLQGYYDHFNLAQRYKNRFPELLNQSFSQDKFEFRFDTKERTGASAFSFADGMYGTTSGVYFPEPLDDDMVIKPYASCKKWDDDVDSNDDTKAEDDKFDDGAVMTALIEVVSQRLGFDKKLKVDDISAMYDSCRFDKAWHLNEISPWCAVFSDDELQVLEYRADMLEYYNAGYGNDLNLKVGCPPVKDFLDRFSKIESGEDQPVGVFYFSHSTMLEMVLSVLGIAKDSESLTHSNYEAMKSRKWRMSELIPFAANLVTVLFQCDAGYKVQFYLNEYPLEIDGCEQGLCDWSHVQDMYGSISDDCNLDFC